MLVQKFKVRGPPHHENPRTTQGWNRTAMA